MSSRARVVIVGAGFGGLALARALQLAGVSAIVYEQTGLHEQVAVGGELRVPSAKRVLSALGLKAQWEALHARATQPDCLPLQGLRDALASSLSSGRLHCGRRVVSLTSCGSEVQVEFEDGSREAADFAVVASGMAAPRVTRLMS